MKLNSKTIKFIGGGLIVITAFSILMPGLWKIIMGIWRIGVWIVTAVILAWLVAYIYSQLVSKRRYERESSETSKPDSTDIDT